MHVSSRIIDLTAILMLEMDTGQMVFFSNFQDLALVLRMFLFLFSYLPFTSSMIASNVKEQLSPAFVFELAKALYTPQAPPQPHAEPLQFDAANIGDQQKRERQNTAMGK